MACLIGIKTTDNQVGRCTDNRTESTKHRGIAQRDQQFGGFEVELLRPNHHHLNKHRHHRRIAQHGTGR